MTWFDELVGIEEGSPEQVRQQIRVEGERIVCPNGKRLAFGRLETPKLSELRAAVAATSHSTGRLTVREVVGDVRRLHADPANADALFQVASQFNLLEMACSSVTPEQGVGIYERDCTQGPACAIACGAGTIYRNYFVPVGDGIGQSSGRQIDCSADLGKTLGNPHGHLWTMENGYLFPSDHGLKQIASRLQSASESELEHLRGELRIGLQWNAQVTLPGVEHRVSQAYCSALPVAYGRQPVEQWTDFAQLILDAAYEATFCAAVLNAARTQCRTLYLTLLGGGVFGNNDTWILNALERAAKKHPHANLDVAIVSYGSSKASVAALVQRLS